MNRVNGFNSPRPQVGKGAQQPLSCQQERGIIGLWLFSLLPLITVQAADTPSLAKQISVCSLQTDEKQRLACYDALALNLKMDEKPVGSAGSEPINEENALFKLSCAYFAKDC